MPNFYSPYQQYPQQFPQQYPQYNAYPAQQQSQQNQTPQIQNGGFLFCVALPIIALHVIRSNLLEISRSPMGERSLP